MSSQSVRQFLRVGNPVVAALLWAATAAAQSPDGTAPAPQPAAPQQQLSWDSTAEAEPPAIRVPETLRRKVHRFTFEEAEIRPLSMPINFYRYEAPDHGYPPFGTMQPADDRAYDGRWSFAFELDGGSMAARIPTGVVPAVSSGRYIITTWVCTENLKYSRASVAAWLSDIDGEPLAASRAESRLVQTNGAWQQIAVELSAEHENASDLILELRLTQPAQQPGNATLITPGAEDVTGRAWFDDVTIWHAPSIELATNHRGNVIDPDAVAQLRFHIRDLAGEPLTADLRLYDIDGAVVHQRRFDQPGDFGLPRSYDLPPLHAGWYRAVLDLRTDDLLVGRQWVDFIALAETHRERYTSSAGHRFAIRLEDPALNDRPWLVDSIDQLNIDTVFLPIWSRNDQRTATTQQLRSLIDLGAQLLRRGHEVIITLDEVPAPLAEALDVDRGQVLEALGSESSIWRPYLDEPMLSLGLEATRWMIGGATNSNIDTATLAGLVDRAEQSLGAFVPNPELILAWPLVRAEQPDADVSIVLNVPDFIRAADLHSALKPWIDREGDVIADINTGRSAPYTQRQIVDDLAQRTLHSWRAGVREFVIDAPWSDDQDRSPLPAFVAWRTLADQLTNRTFIAELHYPNVAECWIIRGSTPDDAALIAWADAQQHETAQLDMLLADGPVRVVDIFGNEQTVEPVDGRHCIPLSQTPVFVDGIDLNLALFRAGFAIEPAVIPSVHRLHEVRVVLQNPWDISISGTISIQQSDGWRMNPRVSSFAIGPGEQAELPIDLVFDRNVLSNVKPVNATVSLLSDRRHEFNMHSTFEIGTDDLHVSARWQIAPNDAGSDDLLITQYVSNRGTSSVTVRAFMHAPGFAPQVRPIGRIDPGDTSVQTFRIIGGAATLAGVSVRYGVNEVDGSTRLNRVLHIPAIHTDAQAVAPTP